uniref:Cyclic nucleotide-binding domain-containing protein n=1 Tax=Astatotilapia calliptera TaxID=8154 RepID=A0AAX7SDN2_ASTCA
MSCVFYSNLSVFSEEAPPPPVVYSRYTDDTIRFLAKKLKERTEILKEKAIDPYATSPEVTPPKGSSHKSAAPALTSSSIQWRKKWMSSWGPPLILSQVSITPKLNEFFVFAFKYLTDISVILSPDRRYISWLSFVALAYNYNVWFCSARLAFPYHSETANRYWIFLDILSDIVNIIDIIVWQPRLQFVKAGDIITDIISILPFDLLCLYFEFSSFYRLNRFIRIGSFFEFSDRLESVMAKAYIWRVARTTGYLLFMLHLNACAYYVASVHQGLATTTWVYDGNGTAYLRCYYFAVRSLINIGGLPEPVTTFEISFQMANFFIGVFVFSSLIGQMRDVIGAATAAQTYFRASMDGCVSYMNTYTIPKLVQNRVRTWYNYTWAAQGMLDESELLDKMPLVMRIAIAVDINLATFQKIALFQGCDQQMLVDMLLRLKSIIYLPGDFVVKKGDIGKEMYIIKSGAVQVVGGPDNSIVFVTLKAGSVFGEISLLQSAKDGGNRRTANVKAHGFANLFVLEKKDLFDILVHYPESEKVLARKAVPAKGNEEKQKGLALFPPKPPTPKLLRAFANMKKLKVNVMWGSVFCCRPFKSTDG